MRINTKPFLICVVLASGFLQACDPGTPGGSGFTAGGYAKPLSQAEFNRLPPEQQYEVANKLLGTMFKGLNPEDFFDTSDGIQTLKPASTSFLADIKNRLETPLLIDDVDAIVKEIDGIDENGIPVESDAKYVFDDMSDNSRRPMQRPLALIKELPVSKDLMVDWMAYFLANTIMFSPATEMDAPNSFDANNMYFFLTSHLSKDSTVREIVRANLPTLARWRVSRSAENQALEAFELYLGLFDTEEDSRRGGIACKQYYLTSEAEDYLLAYTGEMNTIPQLVLENNYVTTCEDLYDVVAGHELLMPRVTEVIINYLMSGRSQEDRLKMNAAINSSGAKTFQDIFLAILFSKEYLLNTERPKSYEESLLPMMDRLKWDPRSNQSPVDRAVFINMSRDRSGRMDLGAMGWDMLTYKIGRLPDVPVDFKSFANYHKSLREDFLMRDNSYQGGINSTSGLFYDDAGDVHPFIAQLNLNDFVDYLFLTALSRRASDVEKTDLTAIFQSHSYVSTITGSTDLGVATNRHDEIAAITFDYISRLPEFYYFKAIN